MLPNNVSASFTKGAVIAKRLMSQGRPDLIPLALRNDGASFNIASYGRDRTEGSHSEDDEYRARYGVSGYSRRRAESSSDKYLRLKSGDEPCGCGNCQDHGLMKSQCGCSN